ncbi:unnamed protein product [Lactuca virosa]|uniref:Uncharacterized protein n=1 Tax=Lactuca virosa TaxID=75947 RepID=A0AAU9N5A2_9ASTR|nr:unnamed protein product [Lactuca virosa]
MEKKHKDIWSQTNPETLKSEVKSRNLTSLAEQSVPDPVNPEPSLEIPPSSTFHECPIIDSKIKLVEESLLGYTNDAVDSKSISDLNLEKPPSGSTIESLVSSKAPSHLSIVVVFEQKLFGSSFGQSQSVVIESAVIVVNPLPLGTSTYNSTTLDIPLIIVDVVGHESASDEKTLDRARSYLMEGMHLLNEGLKQLRKIHDQTEAEAKELREKVSVLSERNQCLVRDLSENLGCQEELKMLNKDLQLKSDDAISHRVAATKELEEVSQQFQSPKLQYIEKVSQLEISCSGKDVSIKFIEE